MSEEDVELARRLYPPGTFDVVPLMNDAEFLEAYKPFMHPEFEMVGEALAMEGPVEVSDLETVRRGIRGFDGFIEGWRKFLAAWETWVITSTDFIDLDDNRVLIMLSILARSKTHQVEIPIEGANIITIRDGKIARLELFSTKAEALAAAGLSE